MLDNSSENVKAVYRKLSNYKLISSVLKLCNEEGIETEVVEVSDKDSYYLITFTFDGLTAGYAFDKTANNAKAFLQLKST